MTVIFNPKTPESYLAFFGKEKFMNLFQEYSLDTLQKFRDVEELIKKPMGEEMRVIYHSLKSASLVFGLDSFAELCAKIENKIVVEQFDDELKQEIKNSRKLWDESVKHITSYLEG